MANLGYTQAQWTRFFREMCEAFLGPVRLLREVRATFFEERTQIVNQNDATSATPHITALTLSGVNYGTNTATDGTLYVRFVADGGGNWHVSLYKATGGGGGDEMAKATSVAASATGTLAAVNSSGLTGSVTLGATIAAETNDRHRILVFQDVKARLKNIFTGTDSVEDDEFSRLAAMDAYVAVVSSVDQAISALKTGFSRMMLSDTGNPVARGNSYLVTNDTTLISDVPENDGSDNISRVRTGLLPRLKSCMADETTGGEQDVVRIVPSAAAGVFQSANDGLGTVASHSPLEHCPASRWTFKCVRGVDTGDLGREQFDVTVNYTDTGDDRVTRDTNGPVVGKTWSGPHGFGPISVVRTPTKTGDGSNLHLATVASLSVTGITNDNSDAGILYWQVDTGWIYSFYKSSTRTASSLVAKATGVSTGAAFTATEQNSSGLTVAWTAGSAPVNGTQGTVDVNGFHAENASGIPDEFSVTVTLAASPGLLQQLFSDEFGFSLNSDTSGSESIPDNLIKRGTFAPFIAQDN